MTWNPAFGYLFTQTLCACWNTRHVCFVLLRSKSINRKTDSKVQEVEWINYTAVKHARSLDPINIASFTFFFILWAETMALTLQVTDTGCSPCLGFETLVDLVDDPSQLPARSCGGYWSLFFSPNWSLPPPGLVPFVLGQQDQSCIYTRVN